MVAGMAVKGPGERFQAVQDQKLVNMRNKTLGTLVSAFTGDHLTAASMDVDVDLHNGTSSGGHAINVPWVSVLQNLNLNLAGALRANQG
jgi:hypothetical protein